MTFAYGMRTRHRVVTSLANLHSFEAVRNKGLDYGLVGLRGPYVRLTGARYGALPEEYTVGLNTAQYVVYAYGTPIAWVNGPTTDEPFLRINFLPDWQYNATTTYYQNLIREAWGGRVIDPAVMFSRVHNDGTRRGRTSDARYGRTPLTQDLVNRAVEPRPSTSTPPRYAAGSNPVRIPDPRLRGWIDVERQTVRYTPEDPFGPSDGDDQPSTRRLLTNRAVLLDPRYADPDWIPPQNEVELKHWDGEPVTRPGEARAHP